MEPECWDRIFQPISLHGLLEHLPSDVKNIKKLMLCIAKYIENEKININKSNNVPELKEVDESAWKLISAIYSLGWDLLFADKNNNSFRQKVAFKCTPNVNSLNNSKKEEKNIDKLANIEKLPPPILAKLSKEVKEISKFFKTTSSANRNKNSGKSYA